ncbi:MAG: NAD(P)(+) transhydrogenase (Re/Si-specific) subunit alpha [Acidobacteria bacterium]|nr:MAG: NAD(P)(+) transhydrogenase (Re/Si-specific) subunit alpha [Acidobacteriota bacterium]
MIAGVLKETSPGERRVAVVPSAFPLLAKAGVEVVIESGAGAAAGFPDGAFKDKGARIASSRSEVLEAARVLLQVRPRAGAAGAPSGGLEGMGRDHVLVGLLDPLGDPAGIQTVAARGITAFALELIPRITRAQAMDVLSSSATITGYKAVLLAASALPQMFPMLMTAGGTLAPARVFVIGAGVAGLQAIATAKRLGAVVQAYDVRPAVKEQVESLGAKFVELPLEAADAQDKGGYARAMDESFYRRQRETMLKVVAGSEVVITTAAVPGKKAPILLTSEMVDAMPPGAVVVDVAAEQGGNCELTRPGETVTRGAVSILGPVNLPSTVPQHASQLYCRNMATFLALIVAGGELKIDLADEIVRETLVTRDGEVVHPRVREALAR